jgi:hypothetical protein
MNTHITILEFLVLSTIFVFGWVLVKTIYQTLKSK